MPLDLNGLSEAERAELLEALQHPPEDPVKTLAKVVDMLIGRMKEREAVIDALSSRVDKLEAFIEKDLIGGVLELSAAQDKAKRLEGLRGTYGEMFAPHETYIRQQVGDGDFYELLGDHLDSIKGQEGYVEADVVKALADEIARRVAELTGTKPAEGKASESDEAEEPEADPLAFVKSAILKLKTREDGSAA